MVLPTRIQDACVSDWRRSTSDPPAPGHAAPAHSAPHHAAHEAAHHAHDTGAWYMSETLRAMVGRVVLGPAFDDGHEPSAMAGGGAVSAHPSHPDKHHVDKHHVDKHHGHGHGAHGHVKAAADVEREEGDLAWIPRGHTRYSLDGHDAQGSRQSMLSDGRRHSASASTSPALHQKSTSTLTVVTQVLSKSLGDLAGPRTIYETGV